MGGLFSGGGQSLGGLFGGGNSGGGGGSRIAALQDGLAQAQALLNGDYAGASTIRENSQIKRLKIQQMQAAQAAEVKVREGLKAHGYSDSDIDVIMSDPKNASDLITEALKDRQFGPEGGSVRHVGAGGAITYDTAPRFDGDGNIYAPGNGTSVPTILQRGTKAIPLQPGGTVAIRDAITGLRPDAVSGGAPTAPQAAPPGNTFSPGQVVNGYRFKGGDDTDQRNWEPVGGAGRSGPPTFP